MMHAARAAAAAAAAASATAAAGASQLVAFAEEKGEGVRSSAADLASRAEDKGEGVRASAAQLVALAENKGEEVCARLGELAQRARGGAQDTDGGGSKGTKAGEGGKSVKGGGGGGAGVRRDYDWAAGQEELGQSEAVLAVAACLAQMLETAESRSLLAMPEARCVACEPARGHTVRAAACRVCLAARVPVRMCAVVDPVACVWPVPADTVQPPRRWCGS